MQENMGHPRGGRGGRGIQSNMRFAIELILAMSVAVAGAWLAVKVGIKMNAKANGDIRAAAAQERIAAAIERAYPRERLSRPSLLASGE